MSHSECFSEVLIWLPQRLAGKVLWSEGGALNRTKVTIYPKLVTELDEKTRS